MGSFVLRFKNVRFGGTENIIETLVVDFVDLIKILSRFGKTSRFWTF